MNQRKPIKFDIHTLLDYQELAQQLLPPELYTYFIEGSDDQITLKNNILAYKCIHLVPRVLVDMSHFSMETKFLGKSVDLPFGVPPFAMQKLLHPRGETLAAAEAYRRNTVFALSSFSTTNTTEILAVNPSSPKILQVYFMKNPELTKAFIKLAQQQGFNAIVVAVDSQTIGKRRQGQRVSFVPQTELQIFRQIGLGFKINNFQDTANSFSHQVRSDVVWQDIRWLRDQTTLKIILKGVMSPKDIPLAEESGVDAVWVSNHGGRKLDCTPATILALPLVRRKVKELKSKMEIYVDGGVKSGCDIFKCLALGADFVFIGRGFMFSLVSGEQGISKAFDILSEQLKQAMVICGASSTREITGELITKCPKAKL